MKALALLFVDPLLVVAATPTLQPARRLPKECSPAVVIIHGGGWTGGDKGGDAAAFTA